MKETINLAALDVLSGWMIEGQYWEAPEPINYKALIEECKHHLSYERNKELNGGLKKTLKYALNQLTFDWESFLGRTALHTLETPEKTRQLFEFAWDILYPNETWKTELLQDFEVIDDPTKLT
jgi:hypothetical protein